MRDFQLTMAFNILNVSYLKLRALLLNVSLNENAVECNWHIYGACQHSSLFILIYHISLE